MADDIDRAIKDYVVLTPQVVHPGIVRLEVEATNFELKPVMFQILQIVGQFNGLPSEDPHIHLKLFLEVSDAFKIAGATHDALRLRLFPYSLRDRARAWLNSLPSDCITTWNDLADKFLMKYFPPTKNAKLRNEITSFHQLEDKSLRYPYHGIPCCIQLETFYNGLNPSTRLMVGASANGALLSKSYTEAYEILERIANNNYQWSSTRHTAMRGAAGVHNIDAITTLSAQVTSFTDMVKAMTSTPAAVKQVAELSCVYCGEEHVFDNCPGNPASVNYNVDVPVDVTKKGLELNSSQEPPQDESMLQQPSHQDTGASGQATATLEGNQPINAEEEVATPVVTTYNKSNDQRLLHINIPFMEALEQMPNYMKFLKDILIRKRRLGEFKTVALTQECSHMLQSKIPKKLKDPGSFTIPCSIGTRYNSRALCDLGASINLISLSPTTITLQLADKSHAYPEGKIKDVLVKVDKFIFPVDFIVLDFKADKEVSIILGRPFLATEKTLTDVQKRELTMRVNDQQVTFNVLEAMMDPDEVEDFNFLCVVDLAVADKINRCCSNTVNEAVTFERFEEEDVAANQIDWVGERQSNKHSRFIELLNLSDREVKATLPSIESPPTLELKLLPSHLKYAYLGQNNTLHVIISFTLDADQERSLVDVLGKYRKAI
ncbi:hypothetical protein KPL70_017015 [Citrus sinensis]|nr:hypothetical protein KPL70_017015 [Citrus sinensis]